MTSSASEFDRVNSVALPNTIFSPQHVKPAPMFCTNQRLAMRKDIIHNILIPQVSHMLNTIFTPYTFRTINTIPTVTFPLRHFQSFPRCDTNLRYTEGPIFSQAIVILLPQDW
jgi:hypothetical protein